jgi:hypothetical protein
MITSCGDDDDNGGGKISIVGTWVDGTTTMKLGSDGSYNLTDTSVSGIPQYRKGSYSYNSNQNLLTVNVSAVAGQNSAYQQNYIVQTLTASTLVLLYTDGDVEGYYTRK